MAVAPSLPPAIPGADETFDARTSAAETRSSLAFISLKAYGDLVIAVSSLSCLRGAGRKPLLIIGEHLTELLDALAWPGHVQRMRTGSGVPALFDLRKQGTINAVRSGWCLRSEFRALDLGRDTRLVFDKLGFRERLLGGARPMLRLPDAGNVYMAYRTLLTAQGFSPAPDTATPPPRGRRVGIFPGSRLAHKNLSASLVKAVSDRCEASGFRTTTFLLEGERPDLERLIPGHLLIPRSFAALIDTIRSLDAVISADSLPAHLAEHRGRPVFVLTPRPNTYWLPLSAYAARHWALFEDGGDHEDRLARFLSIVSPP